MSIKPVTTAQTDRIRKMASEKGIGRDLFETAFADGSIAAMLDKVNVKFNIAKSVAKLIVDTNLRITIPKLDRFVPSGEYRGGIDFKLCSIGQEFDRLIKTRVEEPVPETKLAFHDLGSPSRDDHIRVRFDRDFEVTLGQFLCLHKAQGVGQSNGPLLINGKSNMAYLSGTKAKSCVVRSYWMMGWNFEVYNNPYNWDPNRRIIVRAVDAAPVQIAEPDMAEAVVI